MKKQYSKKQIQEAIKYWESVLTQMNESNSILLDRLADEFGQSTVFNVTKNIIVDDNLAFKIFNSLNKNFFDSQLKPINIKYLSFNGILNELRKRNSTQLPNNKMLGVYSVLFENDPNKINLSTQLILHDDIILMNKDNLNNHTFIFNVASICHEMIHYFDKEYGEYQDLVKKSFIIKNFINSHTTPTFTYKLNLANLENLKVIPFMYTDKIDVLDYDAVAELLSSIYEKSEFNNDITDFISHTEKLVPGAVYVSKINNKRFCLNTFD